MRNTIARLGAAATSCRDSSRRPQPPKLEWQRREQGGTVGQTKKQVCLICGKPSIKTICDACADKVRGEALNKKKKDEKIKE